MSIESDIQAHLAADATLKTLLGGSVLDKKIYAIRAPQGSAAPYIVYSVGAEGGVHENIDELRFIVKIIAADYDYDSANAIRDRVNTLLDLQDDIDISSNDYYIYHSKKNGGGDIEDTDTQDVIKVVIYDVLFNKKVR